MPKFPTHLKALPNIIIGPIPNPQPIPNYILQTHYPPWNRSTNVEEQEERPLVSKGIDGDAEAEPPYQLQVREEIESSRRGEVLQHACHLDPALHPERSRARERIREEHEEDMGVDPDVPASNGADGIDVCAVVAAYRRMVRREGLEVPVWWAVGVCEIVFWEEFEGWAIKTGSHDDDIAFDELLLAWATRLHTFSSEVELDAIFGKFFDVPT